ncbi:MAG TPA: hypothetical protein VIM18_12735 [Solirubrobacteraceae bacterium]
MTAPVDLVWRDVVGALLAAPVLVLDAVFPPPLEVTTNRAAITAAALSTTSPAASHRRPRDELLLAGARGAGAERRPAGAPPDGRIWIRGGDWPGPPEPAPGPPCPA